LLERQNAVRDHLRELELKLRELTESGQGNSDAARGARQDLRKLEEEMRLLQRQARNRRRDPMMPQQEMPYGMPLDDRPGNPDMEQQVEELRGKVDGMHEEMAQMRQMLQQLLERRQEQKEEIQEFKEEY
jgi:chromosome segregation ATPase